MSYLAGCEKSKVQNPSPIVFHFAIVSFQSIFFSDFTHLLSVHSHRGLKEFFLFWLFWALIGHWGEVAPKLNLKFSSLRENGRLSKTTREMNYHSRKVKSWPWVLSQKASVTFFIQVWLWNSNRFFQESWKLLFLANQIRLHWVLLAWVLFGVYQRPAMRASVLSVLKIVHQIGKATERPDK